ncbi:hypothetical protein [Streptomyces nigrescens]|uniref:hypothetical protein n=1 Tax=Streptomyces nigrescens TaxID=1920 RepID=UPI0037033944
MRIRHRLATAVTTAVLAAGLTALPAHADTNAAAVTCSGWGSYLNATDWDEVKSDRRAYIRSGPYGQCDTVLTLNPGYTVDISCYVVNDYGNTWTYAIFHTGGPIYHGWVYDDSLRYGGSSQRC